MHDLPAAAHGAQRPNKAPQQEMQTMSSATSARRPGEHIVLPDTHVQMPLSVQQQDSFYLTCTRRHQLTPVLQLACSTQCSCGNQRLTFIPWAFLTDAFHTHFLPGSTSDQLSFLAQQSGDSFFQLNLHFNSSGDQICYKKVLMLH